MAATGLQANWDPVTYNSVTLKRINSVRIRQGGTTELYKGDSDVYATVAAALNNTPGVTVTGGDIAGLHAFSMGQKATFTAKHLDANFAAGGAILWTVINAVVQNIEADGSHGAFGSGTLTLAALSSDGTTNPISFTRI